MAGGQEKRQSDRLKRRLMVRFGPETPNKTAFTKNLSASGAFLRTNSVYKPGTTLQLEICFPSGDVGVWAQVVWAKKVPAQLAHILDCGMGVRFINPGADWDETFRKWREGKGAA
jgi:hypothetical protein